MKIHSFSSMCCVNFHDMYFRRYVHPDIKSMFLVCFRISAWSVIYKTCNSNNMIPAMVIAGSILSGTLFIYKEENNLQHINKETINMKGNSKSWMCVRSVGKKQVQQFSGIRFHTSETKLKKYIRIWVFLHYFNKKNWTHIYLTTRSKLVISEIFKNWHG